MYFDEDLEEVNYFNPKKSLANIFYEFFFSKIFFENLIFKKEKNFLTIEKKLTTDEAVMKLKFYFETSPIVFRKIEIVDNDNKTTFSILNPNHNPELSNKFFSMANPLIN